MATARSRSWSPRKESNPYPVGGDDGSVPDRGFGLSDHPRAKDYPLCGENEESIPDLGFGLRGLSAGGRRAKAGPEVGTDDASVPDLGFGLKEKRAGESKEKGAGVEDVIKPKKAYVLGSESKPVPHIRTQDCSKFLGDLKASVEVVHRTASERRASISGPKSTGDGDTATNRSSARDGYTTDTCSDDDLDDSSVLENLASDAVDVREAIEGMEAQLPKLPKINRFLAAIATNSVPTIQEPKTECSLSPPIFDAIVQSVDAFQVIMETVIEQGSGLNISGVLNRGKAVGKASSLAEFEAVRGEIGATLDKLGLLTGLAVECKGALEAIGASVEAAMVSMNGEQRKQMVELFSSAKSDASKICKLEADMESHKTALENALESLIKPSPAKTKPVVASSSSELLEKEIQSLKKQLEQKDSALKSLRKEQKAHADQQAKLRDVRNVMISVEQMCNDFMKEQNDKMARTEEMLVLRLQREKDAEIARKFATLTKENDAILEEHKAVVEAQLRQEFDAKFRRERSKILTEYAQHWEDALARADERQVMLENQFRDHVNEKRRAWKEKLERMQRMERDLCEAKIEALRISNPKRSLEVLDPALADKYVDTMEDFDDTLKDGSIEFHEKNNVGNQTSLDLLIIHPQDDPRDEEVIVAVELQKQLQGCQTELDILEKENATLIQEYTKLRTKFLASEEGIDYLVQRLEALKSIIEDKEKMVKDVESSVEQKSEQKAKEHTLKLRAELQQTFSARIKELEKALCEKQNESLVKQEKQLHKRFLCLKKSYRAKLEQKVKSLNKKWIAFVAKEKKRFARDRNFALANKERNLRHDFQAKFDAEVQQLQEEANAKMRNILNGEQGKLAEALNHQAQLADLLQHEHEMAMKKLRSDLAQDFEARLKATLETERLNSKTTLVARLREAAKNSRDGFMNQLEQDLKCKFPSHHLATSFKYLSLMNSSPENASSKVMSLLEILITVRNSQSGSWPFDRDSPIDEIVHMATENMEKQFPESVVKLSEEEQKRRERERLSHLAKTIGVEVNKRITKKLLQEKEKMREELLAEFKQSNLNPGNGKLLDTLRDYLQAKVAERISAEQDSFERRLEAEKNAWKKKTCAVWKLRLGEIAAILSQKLKQHRAAAAAPGFNNKSDPDEVTDSDATAATMMHCKSHIDESTITADGPTSLSIESPTVKQFFADVKSILGAIQVLQKADADVLKNSGGKAEKEEAAGENAGKEILPENVAISNFNSGDQKLNNEDLLDLKGTDSLSHFSGRKFAYDPSSDDDIMLASSFPLDPLLEHGFNTRNNFVDHLTWDQKFPSHFDDLDRNHLGNFSDFD